MTRETLIFKLHPTLANLKTTHLTWSVIPQTTGPTRVPLSPCSSVNVAKKSQMASELRVTHCAPLIVTCAPLIVTRAPFFRAESAGDIPEVQTRGGGGGAFPAEECTGPVRGRDQDRQVRVCCEMTNAVPKVSDARGDIVCSLSRRASVPNSC